jgi:hypothetical protein
MIIGVPWLRQLRLDHGSRDVATRRIESTQKKRSWRLCQWHAGSLISKRPPSFLHHLDILDC